MSRINPKRATPRRRLAPRWTPEQWAAADTALRRRCGHRCERCGQLLGARDERHHRQRREVGGDRLANLLLLHPSCHAWITEHPQEARANGWIVSSHGPDPAEAPVYLPGLTGSAWWLLDDRGRKQPVP